MQVYRFSIDFFGIISKDIKFKLQLDEQWLLDSNSQLLNVLLIRKDFHVFRLFSKLPCV